MNKQNNIIIIGDVHGCINTLQKLYLKLKRLNTTFYCVGDLVDRGAHSKEVVDFCIRQNILTVIGNHDYWMIESIDNYQNEYSVNQWLVPFGYNTIKSYLDISKYSKSDSSILFLEFIREIKYLRHYNFIKSLPFKIEVNNVIITHSGIAEYATEQEDYLCNYEPCIKFEKKIQIYGHDHKREVEYLRGWYANIDTSCVYGNKLTAVVVDTEKALITDVIQENFAD
jgi:serine/threonine protein phosphatase 1